MEREEHWLEVHLFVNTRFIISGGGGGGEVYGRRGMIEWEVGGNREKWETISQHCIIPFNKKKHKEVGTTMKGLETGVHGTGNGKCDPGDLVEVIYWMGRHLK